MNRVGVFRGGRAFEAKAGAATPASPALISGMNVRTNGGRVNRTSSLSEPYPSTDVPSFRLFAFHFFWMVLQKNPILLLFPVVDSSPKIV